MDLLLSSSDLDGWHRLIDPAAHIVITCHKNPDGDAIGAATALRCWLLRHGKTDVTIIAPNYFPDFLHWLPGADDILLFDRYTDAAHEVLNRADLVVMVDHAELSRMGDTLGDAVQQCPAPRLVIDHHLDPSSDIATLLVSHPLLSSACEVLMRCLLQVQANDSLTHDEALCLYTGMMTDTGAFTYNSNRPEVFQLIGTLLACGIDKDRIYRNVYWTYSPERVRTMGYLLYVKMEYLHKYHAAIMTFTAAEYRRFRLKSGDTEGFVNIPLQIQGTRVSIFLREDTERPVIRVSTRSVDDFPCNELCAEFFHGGGHKNAAGGEFWGTMEDAVKLARQAIQKYAQIH